MLLLTGLIELIFVGPHGTWHFEQPLPDLTYSNGYARPRGSPLKWQKRLKFMDRL